MSSDFRATIREDSPRAYEWLETFGTLEVSIMSPVPTLASAPGIESGRFFLVDLQELTSEQRTRLIAHLAKKSNTDEQEVADELDVVGCPILDEDLTITIFNPQKWL